MPEDMWCRDRFWAPELFENDGKFYATFNCCNESEAAPHNFGVGLAVADCAAGPYKIVSESEPVCSGIDGTVFKDDDGSFYLAANGRDEKSGKPALLLHRINLDTFKLEGTELACTTGDEGDWDFVGVEGQCIVKRNGKYFQWYSSWTDTTYAAGLMTADSIHGPWKKSSLNPLIKETEEYYKCGHNHSFKGLDGKDYIIFHAFCRYDDESDRCERLYIREIEYKADGTVEIKE